MFSPIVCTRIILFARIEPLFALGLAERHISDAFFRKLAIHLHHPRPDARLAIEEARIAREKLLTFG